MRTSAKGVEQQLILLPYEVTGGTGVPIVVRAATAADIPEMTAVLGDVFQDDDPFGEFLFPDPLMRRARQQKMMAALIRHRFLRTTGAVVAVVDGRIGGTLLWHSHPRRMSIYHTLAGGPALLAAMRTRVVAGIAIDAMFATLTPSDPHILGVYLGCAPQLQGNGIGHAMIGHLLAIGDAEGRPIYLTCKDGNVVLYRRLGFEVVERRPLGRSGPVINVMIRQPHPV